MTRDTFLLFNLVQLTRFFPISIFFFFTACIEAQFNEVLMQLQAINILKFEKDFTFTGRGDFRRKQKSKRNPVDRHSSSAATTQTCRGVSSPLLIITSSASTLSIIALSQARHFGDESVTIESSNNITDVPTAAQKQGQKISFSEQSLYHSPFP